MRYIFNFEDASIAFEAENKKPGLGKKRYENKVRLSILCKHSLSSQW